jgi:hypothetical protein
MSAVTGLLLGAGVGATVEPVIIDKLETIQGYVGGVIDAVRQQVSKDICAVGYVHDEGLILDLEMNWIASALFMREIRGPVVLVNGFNDANEYDGDNHDLPDAFVEYMQTWFLQKVAETYNESTIVVAMLEMAVDEGVATDEEVDALMVMLESVSKGDIEEMKVVAEQLKSILVSFDERMADKTTTKLVDEIYEFLDKEVE